MELVRKGATQAKWLFEHRARRLSALGALPEHGSSSPRTEEVMPLPVVDSRLKRS